MEYPALVVADDLTGAMDTGNEFARREYATTVALDGAVRDSDASVAVANTQSRYLPADDAAGAVREAVRTHPADVRYKKIDSTLRGNVVAEVDAVLDTSGADLAVVAPAFPANGRTTEDGVHRVNGTPVTETADGMDPDKSARTSNLPTLFELSAYPVAHLTTDAAERSADAVAEALSSFAEQHGTALVACDATRDAHLASIADGASRSEPDVVYVGSAGLARHVGVPGVAGTNELRPSGADVTDETPRVLGIAGSTNPATVRQVDAVSDDICVDLDLRRTVLDPDAAADDATDRCLERLRDGDAALLTTVGVDPNAALRVGREHEVSERAVRDRISRTLGTVARRIHDEVAVTGLFLTGGEVASDVLDEFATDGIRLAGKEVGTGVPLGWLVGGAAAGARVVTKAGGFGQPGTIPNCLASLGRDDE